MTMLFLPERDVSVFFVAINFYTFSVRLFVEILIFQAYAHGPPCWVK